MPFLNDSRRVARIAMVVDELCTVYNTTTKTFDISHHEFKMCGGIVKENKRYSLHRQLIYAHRDVKCFVKRGHFPSSLDVRKGSKLYTFYEAEMHTRPAKEFKKALRILIVLRHCRYKLHKSCAMDDVRKNIKTIVLNEAEMAICASGANSDSNANTLPFRNVLQSACADMSDFLKRGRFPHPTAVQKANDIRSNLYTSDTESDNEVEHLDGSSDAGSSHVD